MSEYSDDEKMKLHLARDLALAWIGIVDPKELAKQRLLELADTLPAASMGMADKMVALLRSQPPAGGEELYGMWGEVVAEDYSDVTEWPDLEDIDRAQWERMAARLAARGRT